MSKQKPKTEVHDLELSIITPSPTNPRKSFDDASINELAESIAKQGVLQPITVRPLADGYEIVCGERRWRASVAASVLDKSIKTIPAIIKDLSDEATLEIQITENLQRKDVHPLEEAFGFKNLMEIREFPIEEIAQRVGKSARYVAERLKLTSLIADWQKMFFAGRLLIKDAVRLALMPEDLQQEIYNEGEHKEGHTGMISFNNWYWNKFSGDLTEVTFDLTDEMLIKSAGPCSSCQFNSGVGLLFSDGDKPRCMNVKCFAMKTDRSYDLRLDEANNDPAVILLSKEYNSKVLTALQKKGLTVYKDDAVKVMDAPYVPDREEYQDDFEDGDYDSKEEMEESYRATMEDYQKELAEYNEAIAGGKYIKAFVVDGHDKGQWQYVEMRKGGKATAAAAPASVTKEKEASGKLSVTDIAAEILRIEEREKRAMEIDAEKLTQANYQSLQKGEQNYIMGSKGAIGIEKIALIICLMDQGYGMRPWNQKIAGQRDVTPELVEDLMEKTDAMLDSYVAKLTRAMIMHHLTPPQGARPEASAKAAIHHQITATADPKAFKANMEATVEIIDKRKAKVNKRISELKAKADELKKASGTAKKGKGVKALLKD